MTSTVSETVVSETSEVTVETTHTSETTTVTAGGGNSFCIIANDP